MHFIKLNAKILNPISDILGKDVQTIDLSVRQAIKFCAAQDGWMRTITRIIMCYIERPNGIHYELSAKNLLRKEIRFPAFRYIFPLPYLYNRNKKMECMLFSDVIDTALDENPDAVVLIYNGTMVPDSVLAHITKSRGHPRLFLESGYFPNTIQVDPKGINANNSLPDDPEFYLSYSPKPDQPVPISVGIREAKVKYKIAQTLPENYIFVPFQVPSDMQVTELSPWIKSMERFYDALLQSVKNNPDINFVIKEHPSFRRSIIGKVLTHPQITFANGVPAPELISGSRAVVTLNSTVGIEALVLKKKVITLGLSAYNIEGLVLHCPDYTAFTEALGMIDTWQPDEILRRHFLQFLYYEYMIPGTFVEPASDTLEHLTRKMDM